MSDLTVEITSPKGELFKGNCYLVVVPSTLGDLGVLAGHEVVVVSLREGQILIYDNKNNLTKSFDVKSGFAEVQDSGKLLILVD
jgi:F-type H+-transporting ATPase subunit epsilon